MPWLDILIIFILVLCALIGLIRGFLRSVISLCSTLVTLVLAIWLAKPLSGVIDGWFGLSEAIASSLEPTFLNFFATNDTSSGWVAQLISIFLGSGYMESSPPAEQIAVDFSSAVGSVITIIICAVVLYILIRVLLWVLSRLFRKITRNRTIGAVDRILGTVIGVAKGFLYIFIALGIIFLLGSFITPLGAWVDNMIGQNTITNAFYGWTSDFMQNTLLPFFFG